MRCFIIRHIKMALSTTIALLLILQCTWSIPLDQFYPFGTGEKDYIYSFSSKSGSQSPQLVALSDGFSLGDTVGNFKTIFVSLTL